jgi:predicted HicB family RNase H-like nuclease
MNDILQYKDYFASVHYSAVDEIFYGKLLGINDVVTFEGTTVKELKKAFHESVDDYLETCKEVGKDPEKMYKGSFNVRVPTELHRKAALVSSIKNMSLNDFVKYALDFALKHTDEIRNIKTLLLLLTILTPAFIAGFFLV